MIKIDVSLFIQVVNFLFLIWILNIVLYKPIRSILIRRKEEVKNFEREIDTFNRNAGVKDDAFAAGIKEARIKGLKQKELLISAASEEEKRLIEEINQRAQANLAASREKIAKDTEEVKAALQKQIDEFANAIGKKLLGRVV